jgi:hypothetical protein
MLLCLDSSEILITPLSFHIFNGMILGFGGGGVAVSKRVDIGRSELPRWYFGLE